MCLGRLCLMLCNVNVARPMKSFQPPTGAGKEVGNVEASGPEQDGMLEPTPTARMTSSQQQQPCTHCESMRYASNYGPKPERSASVAATNSPATAAPSHPRL